MKSLVQLTIYPLNSPRHGGQLRCSAIRECYRSLGIDVRTIAAMHEDLHRGEREHDDIALSAALPEWQPTLVRFIDLQTGYALANDERAYREFASRLDRLHPDAIQLEQPWLYPAVRRWLHERDRRGHPLLIYSSQNIEWKLKRDEMPAGLAATEEYMGEIERVRALECDLAHAADVVIACTDEEFRELRAMAGNDERHRTFVTARNAISPFEPDAPRTAALKKRLGIERYPMFVGSAHPPNADGFWRMLAPSLAFLRPDEKIVVAGGVGHILRQHPIYADWSGINEPRLLVLGEIDAKDLAALLYGAAVILLPITTGGGSNLKTAEALYTGRPVVSTSHALRGYGHPSAWPSLTIADDSDVFRRAVRSKLDDVASSLGGEYESTRERVTWRATLEGLRVAIAELLSSAASPAPRS